MGLALGVTRPDSESVCCLRLQDLIVLSTRGNGPDLTNVKPAKKWFAGRYTCPLSLPTENCSFSHFLPITSITFINTCTAAWRVISLSRRTPAPPLETASATPTADYSGSQSSSTTSSGTLKSSWWAPTGSRWWGGTQASACPLSEMTSEDTFSAGALRKYSIRRSSYSVLAACKHNVSSFWPMKVACLMKRRLENSNSVVPLWILGVRGSSSVHSGCPEKPTAPCCLLTRKTCCHLCHM